MNISLDFDGTYTEDPQLWDAWIKNALSRRHNVFLITMRHETEANAAIKKLGTTIPLIFTGRRAKQAFVNQIGLHIDVWIDDNPHWILQDSI